MTAKKKDIDNLCINTIRTLSMDAVQKAKSGHPGTPMALAPLVYLLWTKIMRHNPRNPQWFNRDRFILSCGHASMLLYSILYLTGYELSLDDIKKFRQWKSKTPGHPEFGITAGVEMTTGPLGQGFATGVGMAIAEAHLSALFNRKGHKIIDHYTYAVCSDGDMQEGISHEAASLAGHLGLGKLIYFYDENNITIEGRATLSSSDDTALRFKGYNWHIQRVKDINDLKALEKAIRNAQKEKRKPSLIIVNSLIAYGSPNKEDKAVAHGEPLGNEEVALTKKQYGWPEDEKFFVPDSVFKVMNKCIERGKKLEEEWKKKVASYKKVYENLYRELNVMLSQELPKDWKKKIPSFPPSDKGIATRSASGKILQEIAKVAPWIMGGSADLGPSNKTLIAESGDFSKKDYKSRNLHWGIREHAMCACSTGMILHGGIRPYAATFFIFTDYARPAIRLASLMKLPVIYLMTHDSIGLGEDGPTHQPIEQLASLRAMPNIVIIRPCDANETAEAWKFVMTYNKGPVMLVLSRQNLPVLDRNKYASAANLKRGAYIIKKEKGTNPDVIIIATGSEVFPAIEASEMLINDGIDARVVSMPSIELFSRQPEKYKNTVLPPQIKKRISVEAGASLGWHQWVGDEGDIIGIDTFGASAPFQTLFSKYGLDSKNITARVKELLKKK
ncbi:MAG: transketolase [Candidatus Schekmanbacteria bacterium]|nr:MAG: transketolase [Candidatus Schekmanbacteria bacterium]